MRAFSLVEVLLSLAIVAVLLGLLLPTLSFAREAANSTVCASQLRQIGTGWRVYLDEHDQYPPYSVAGADLRFGGAIFTGRDRVARLDPARPINQALVEKAAEDSGELVQVFRCPSDRGVFERGEGPRGGRVSILPSETCFLEFGSSYRANPRLLDSTRAGIDQLHRPLRPHEITVSSTRLLVTGDPAWHFATRMPGDPDAKYEASWHGSIDAGNMLAADGSVRFVRFGLDRSLFTIQPRPPREN